MNGKHLFYCISSEFELESRIIFSVNGQNNNCYRQTCNQAIRGRRLRYRRALEIVQNEEYLAAATPIGQYPMILNFKVTELFIK